MHVNNDQLDKECIHYDQFCKECLAAHIKNEDKQK